MTADTPIKRLSAMNLTMPWRGVAVIPSGTVTAGARTALLYLYSGITEQLAVSLVSRATTLDSNPADTTTVGSRGSGTITLDSNPADTTTVGSRGSGTITLDSNPADAIGVVA